MSEHLTLAGCPASVRQRNARPIMYGYAPAVRRGVYNDVIQPLSSTVVFPLDESGTTMHSRFLLFIWFLTLLASVLGAVTWSATPFNPPSVPLAVRTPYLSAWLAQGSGTALNAAWPTFWTGSVSQ